MLWDWLLGEKGARNHRVKHLPASSVLLYHGKGCSNCCSPWALHVHHRCSVQACQPEGIAAHPHKVGTGFHFYKWVSWLGNAKGIVLQMQQAHARLSVSSLSKAVEHPAISHGRRPFWWYQARREKGKGKGTGKIMQRSEMRRGETYCSWLNQVQSPKSQKWAVNLRLPAT